jgi:hypothetical protein
MNTKSTVAILAIVAISTILVGSVSAEDALAKKCRRSGGGGGNDNSVCSGLYKPKRSMSKRQLTERW